MEFWIEAFGYLGSLLVIVSMLMTSVLKLRVINTLGSVVCVIYGIIIKAYPTVAMNAVLIAINLYGLWRLSGDNGPDYHMELADIKDSAVQFLLTKYKGDIGKFFADFQGAQEGQTAYLVMNGDLCVGLLLGTLEDGTLRINLDYTTPGYRDFSIGHFLYGKLADVGVEKVIFIGTPGDHGPYLKRMNFVLTDGHYERKLK